jgi:hypothetical protein
MEMSSSGIQVPGFIQPWMLLKALSDQTSDAAILQQVGGYPAPGQQDFGAGFDIQHRRESWSSTVHASAVLRFTMKDALLAVDDFVGRGRRRDASCGRDICRYCAEVSLAASGVG